MKETEIYACEAYVPNSNNEYSRKNTLKLKSVPQRDRENVEIVQRVLEKGCKVNIRENDVLAIYRIPVKTVKTSTSIG